MGLKITSTQEKRVNIKNTDIEIPEVYVRVGWESLPTGKHIKITSLSFYQSKENYKNNPKAVVPTDINIPTNSQVGLIFEVEEQTWEKVAERLIWKLGEIGYQIEIFEGDENI